MPNSLVFVGDETSYLHIPYDPAMDIALGADFTIEWYQYQTDENPNPRIFQRGVYSGEDGVDIPIGVSIEGGYFYLWLNSNPNMIVNLTDYKNKWIHFAISRNSGIIRVFMDGVQTTYETEINGELVMLPYSLEDDSAFISLNDLTIGNENVVSTGAAYGGYMYGFHWVNGVGKYTTDFVMPTSVSLDENTVLYLTGGGYEGELGSTLVNYNVGITSILPPNIAPADPEAPDYRMIPFIQAQRRPVLSNNLIFYKPGSLASCGVGGITNSRVKSRRT